MIITNFTEDIQFNWRLFQDNFSYTEEELIVNIMTDLIESSNGGYTHSFNVIPLMGEDVSEALDALIIDGERFINIVAYDFLIRGFSFLFVYGNQLQDKFEMKSMTIYGSKFSTRFLLQSINREKNYIERYDSVMGKSWCVFRPQIDYKLNYSI